MECDEPDKTELDYSMEAEYMTIKSEPEDIEEDGTSPTDAQLATLRPADNILLSPKSEPPDPAEDSSPSDADFGTLCPHTDSQLQSPKSEPSEIEEDTNSMGTDSSPTPVACLATNSEKVFIPAKLKEALMPVLKQLYSQEPESLPFREPVDPVALNIPDYFDKIFRPMDLSTIKKQLDTGQYKNPWEFVNDVRLMLNNAQLYNNKSCLVYKYSTKDTDKTNTCAVCGRHFSKQSNLRQHERIHRRETKYTCCGKGFESKANLQRHRCSVHGETKPFVCGTCSKEFATQADLSRHKRRENQEFSAVCDICGFRTDCKSKLKEHMSRHTNELIYSCAQCENRYKYRSGLTRHVKDKHS